MNNKHKQIAYKDKANGFEWSIVALNFTWDYAVQYTKNDLEDLSFHLPTLQEFQILLDYTRKGTAWKKGVTYPLGIYWTSTEYANNSSSAWCVDTQTGQIRLSSKTNLRNIIAVRNIK